jgi:hydrogen cyanide synthase HcnC
MGEAVGLGCGVIYHSALTSAGSPANPMQHAPEPLPDVYRDFLLRSNACFPRLAEELNAQSGVEIEFAEGAGLLFVIESDAESDLVNAMTRSFPPNAKFERLGSAAVARIEPQLRRDIVGGILLHGEHQVNPMLLAEAFKRSAIRLGATFRSNLGVTALRRRGDRIVGIEAGEEFLPCSVVVNAAGAWAGRLAATADIEVPVIPVRGQIVLTDALPRVLSACISTSSCYLVQKAHGEVLIGSTTEHAGFDVGVTPQAMHRLCHGAVRTVPCLTQVRIKRAWAGLRPGTSDELPILGPDDELEGYCNATGGFRTGIVASPLTGKVVTQWVLGEMPDCDRQAFLASRFRSPRIVRQAASLTEEESHVRSTRS